MLIRKLFCGSRNPEDDSYGVCCEAGTRVIVRSNEVDGGSYKSGAREMLRILFRKWR